MIDWYREYDEIHAELREMAARREAEMDNGTSAWNCNGRLFIGSGEDVPAFTNSGRISTVIGDARYDTTSGS